jgi:hypothetical protein
MVNLVISGRIFDRLRLGAHCRFAVKPRLLLVFHPPTVDMFLNRYLSLISLRCRNAGTNASNVASYPQASYVDIRPLHKLTQFLLSST